MTKNLYPTRLWTAAFRWKKVAVTRTKFETDRKAKRAEQSCVCTFIQLYCEKIKECVCIGKYLRQASCPPLSQCGPLLRRQRTEASLQRLDALPWEASPLLHDALPWVASPLPMARGTEMNKKKD